MNWRQIICKQANHKPNRTVAIGVMMLCAVVIVADSCHPPPVAVQNIEGIASPQQSSLRFIGPTGSASTKPLLLVQQCQHLYNVGRSWEWRECMGVGRK